MNTSVVFVNDIDLTIRVMRDAASWMKVTGKKPSEYWQEEILNREYLLKQAEPSDFIVGLIGQKPAIACLLQDNERNQSWKYIDGDNPKKALYIHWLCVAREFAGMNLPEELIAFAKGQAQKRNQHMLRLDTEADRIKLRKIYERLGFALMGIDENTAYYQMNLLKYDRVYILHGCPPSEETVTPKEHRWMNWLEGQLNSRGLPAVASDFPRSWNPKYSVWKRAFETYPISKETLLVGHSCGGAFFVRYLLETKQKVRKLILVAPAKVPETETDTRKDLYDFALPANATHIADEIVIFTSNDFPHHLQSLELYKRTLKPRIMYLENKFHFLFFQMKTYEFPELLREITSR